MPIQNPFLLSSSERFIELINFKYGWLCISPIVGSPLPSTNAEVIDYSDRSNTDADFSITYRIDKLGYFGSGNPPAAMIEEFPGSDRSRYFTRNLKLGKLNGEYMLRHYSLDGKYIYMPVNIDETDLDKVAAAFYSALHLQVSKSDIESVKRNVDGTLTVNFSKLSQYFDGSINLNDRDLPKDYEDYQNSLPQL